MAVDAVQLAAEWPCTGRAPAGLMHMHVFIRPCTGLAPSHLLQSVVGRQFMSASGSRRRRHADQCRIIIDCSCIERKLPIDFCRTAAQADWPFQPSYDTTRYDTIDDLR